MKASCGASVAAREKTRHCCKAKAARGLGLREKRTDDRLQHQQAPDEVQLEGVLAGLRDLLRMRTLTDFQTIGKTCPPAEIDFGGAPRGI